MHKESLTDKEKQKVNAIKIHFFHFNSQEVTINF